MQRDQEQRSALRMEAEMRRAQAIQQEVHQQTIAQLEAQPIQNEIRHAEARCEAAEREDDLHLSQQAEQFRREQEAQADSMHREQELRDQQEAAAYDQVRVAEED